jgi:hypothetical protein
MSHRLDLSNHTVKHKDKRSTGDLWEAAIAEAETRIADLKFSIKVFKKNKDLGRPWLGQRASATHN